MTSYRNHIFEWLVTREWHYLGKLRMIRVGGLFGVPETLLKEVCSLRWALIFQKIQPGPISVFCQLLKDPNVKLSGNNPAL